MSDDIKRPAHYTWHPSGIECKTIAQEFLYNIGSAIKYLWRADYKGNDIKDLRKAIESIENEIRRRESAGAKGRRAGHAAACGNGEGMGDDAAKRVRRVRSLPRPG